MFSQSAEASCWAWQDFDLDARKGEVESVVGGNAFMAELQSRIVPLIVQHDAFWTRYFYQWAPPLAVVMQCFVSGQVQPCSAERFLCLCELRM